MSFRAPSLFASQRLIELRLPTAQAGQGRRRGHRRLLRASARRHRCCWSPAASGASKHGGKWSEAIARAGHLVVAWPVRAATRWPAGSKRACASSGVQADRDAVQRLVERVEGNLLAAAQEIDKLALLADGKPLDAARMESLVADAARFDVFRLLDAAMNGQGARVSRMLAGLRAEGEAVPALMGMVVKELLLVAALARVQARGGNLAAEFKAQRVWDSKQADLSTRAAAPRRVALGALRGRGRTHRPHRQGPRGGRCLAGAGAPAAGGGRRARRGRCWPRWRDRPARLLRRHLRSGPRRPSRHRPRGARCARYRGPDDAGGRSAASRRAGCDAPSQRAAMLDLAVAGEPGLCVDRRELQREGRSYSIDTLRALRVEYGADAPIALLVGADSFARPAELAATGASCSSTPISWSPSAPAIRSTHALPAELAEALAGRWCDAPRCVGAIASRAGPAAAPATARRIGDRDPPAHRRRRALAGPGARGRRRLHPAPPSVPESA